MSRTLFVKFLKSVKTELSFKLDVSSSRQFALKVELLNLIYSL